VIRTAIVDDHALVRAGFALLLNSTPDIEVVGEAATGAEAVAMARSQHPDVVLMDLQMPGAVDGLAATRLITTDATLGTRVLVLTTFDLDEYVMAALRNGASGFLLKDCEPEELLTAVRVVANGDALLAPTVTRRLIARFQRGSADTATRPRPKLERLTAREREVLVEVAHGRSNHEIAENLLITYATAKTHVSRLLTKLDAQDRAQLVVIAYETGVVTTRAAAQGEPRIRDVRPRTKPTRWEPGR